VNKSFHFAIDVLGHDIEGTMTVRYDEDGDFDGIVELDFNGFKFSEADLMERAIPRSLDHKIAKLLVPLIREEMRDRIDDEAPTAEDYAERRADLDYAA